MNDSLEGSGQTCPSTDYIAEVKTEKQEETVYQVTIDTRRRFELIVTTTSGNDAVSCYEAALLN